MRNDQVYDARRRLCKAGCAVVPEHGCQFASLIQSPDINSITSVKCWEGIDLRWFNTLQARSPPISREPTRTVQACWRIPRSRASTAS